MLLAALARLAVPGLRALHVDHGLHADSAAWERRCRATAEGLGVPYGGVRVAVEPGGAGPEAAARKARYAAFAAHLAPGETLLTAHHADDQLETLLLRVLRGTGVRGLRGVLPRARLGAGFLARPLLDFRRAELRGIAVAWRLNWLEDPSNADLAFDRNYMRTAVLPALVERWPGAARTAARLAAAAADAERILADTARRDLAACSEGGRPEVARLRELDAARQRNALREAVRAAGLPMPGARQLEALRAALAILRPDARTLVCWPGGEARTFRGRLYLLAPPATAAAAAAAAATAHAPAAANAPAPTPAAAAAPWACVSAAEPWAGPQGRLVLEPGAGPGLPEAVALEGLEVRFRAGGERFRPAGSAHARKLKTWFQEQGIVPWMRDRIPLLYWRGRLLAVADLALDEAAASATAAAARDGPAARAWRVRWEGHGPLR